MDKTNNKKELAQLAQVQKKCISEKIFSCKNFKGSATPFVEIR